MKMSDKELIRQEVNVDATNEARDDDNRFGNWPELVGVIFTALVAWMIFEFRG